MQVLDVADAPARDARIFLSYKRHAQPDQTLAHEMVEGLSRAGCTVFIDRRLTVGQEWAQEIEAQVRHADFLIVFLTAESSRSEMVRGEIELARRHAACGCGPRILPVRVAFDGPLPYPLSAYLDGIQYATWNDLDDSPRLLEELLAAMAGQRPVCEVHSPIRVGLAPHLPPAYAAPLPVPAACSTSTTRGTSRGRRTPPRSP